jgi:hypothetical protein
VWQAAKDAPAENGNTSVTQDTIAEEAEPADGEAPAAADDAEA